MPTSLPISCCPPPILSPGASKLSFVWRCSSPTRIVLYGSRARGDANLTSDFDLWFEGVRDGRGFARLEDDARNEFVTLYPTGIVDARDAGPELAAEVAAQGKCLYERRGSR